MSNLLSFKQAASQTKYFEGEDTGAGDTGAGDTGAGDTGAADKTFSQADVDQLMANHRKTLQNKYATAAEELQAAKKASNASQEEIDNLTSNLAHLQDTFATDKEIADRKMAKLSEDNASALGNATAEADKWRTMHYESLIDNSLTQAAVLEKAYDPSQIVGLFGRNAEIIDVDGKLTVMVAVTALDKDKKPTTLKLTPVEAVKEIASQERHANLFHDGRVGGLGRKGSSNASKINPKDVTMDQYKNSDYRKSLGLS